MNTKLLKTPDYLLEQLADGLRILAHPDRLRIIEVLEQEKSASVGQIEVALNRPQSAISQHLGRMKRAGLLDSTRCGKSVCYRIADDRPLTILNCIREKINSLKKEMPK